MGIETARTGKLLYHITSIDNLDSIITHGLISRSKVSEKELTFDDIADPEIIHKRGRLGLDNYVPFHFHPYSAFDVAVKNRYNAKNMMYLCISRTLARENGFKILPKHPLSGEEYYLYVYDEGFALIDWDTMTNLNQNDRYAREVRMAECLTDKIIPIKAFTCIFVANEEAKNIVIEKMRRINFPPPYININQTWFDGYD